MELIKQNSEGLAGAELIFTGEANYNRCISTFIKEQFEYENINTSLSNQYDITLESAAAILAHYIPEISDYDYIIQLARIIQEFENPSSKKYLTIKEKYLAIKEKYLAIKEKYETLNEEYTILTQKNNELQQHAEGLAAKLAIEESQFKDIGQSSKTGPKQKNRGQPPPNQNNRHNHPNNENPGKQMPWIISNWFWE